MITIRNRFEISNEFITIFLERKNGEVCEAIIDLDDLEKVLDFDVKWSPKWRETTNSFYAQATEYLGMFLGKPRYKNHYLHKFILDSPKDEFLDHKNHNTLDCRKENLIRVSNKENLVNRRGANTNNKTGHRNVCFNKTTNKYLVQLQVNGVNRKFGEFNTLEEAVECAETNRKRLYKEIYKNAT